MKASLRLLAALLVFAPPALAQEPSAAPAEPPSAATPAAEAAAPASPPEPAGAEVSEAGKVETVTEQSKLKTEKKEVSGPAGEAEPEATRDDRESGEDDTFGHGMQVGIRAGFVLGYRMSFRYDNSPFCKRPEPLPKAANKQQKICGFGAPPAAEVALSFAPFDSVEPYIFGRFGLSGESETNTKPLKLFGLGARIYTNADARFKVFVEPALAYEIEGGAGNPEWNRTDANYKADYKKDMVFHVGIGGQYDFAKAFGLFLNLGIDVGVFRSISATLMGNIGAQIRFP